MIKNASSDKDVKFMENWKYPHIGFRFSDHNIDATTLTKSDTY